MKRIKINVSSHSLTRCASCGRHHSIDQSLSSAELLLLTCDFCGGHLIGDQTKPSAQLKTKTIGQRSSKLAMGLLSAGLLFTGCDDDEPIESTAGVEVAGADDAGIQAMYGGPPIDQAGIEEAGTEEAGNEVAGTEEAGVEIAGAEDAGIQALYGAPPPAGEEGS